LTVQDNGGCTSTLDFSIGVADPFVFLILDTTDSNCGADDGTVNMLATGGIGGFTYAIDGVASQMSGSFSGLASGTYTAVATDGADCIQELEFTIGMSNDLSLFAVSSNPTCSGGMDGSITLSLDEEGEPYTLEWTGDGAVQDETMQTNLGAGIYTVIVTDVNGCSLTGNYELVAGTTLLVDGSDVQNVTCNDASDGLVALSVSGGTAPYTYTLNDESNTSGEFDGLAAGMYQIDVEDANGCTGQVTVSIEEPLAILLNIIEQTEAGCDGDTSGSATIAATNTVGVVTYELGGMTNETGIFEGLAGGSYTASATDANGCTMTANVVILQNTTLTGSLITSENVTCAEGNDGSATVEGSAGSGTYKYALDGGPSQDNGTFDNLIAGDYEATISDTEGCSFIVSFTITESSSVAFVIDEVVDASCHDSADGSVTFHIEGGTAPYLLISEGNELDVMGNGSITFDEVEAGTYAVMITDANGCSIESSVTVGAPEELEFVLDYLTNVTCNDAVDASFGFHIEGGTLPYQISVDGEVVLDINDNEIIESDNEDAQNLDLLIMDANGCTTSFNFVVTEPDPLEFVINEQQPASCFDVADAYISFQIEGGTAPYQAIESGDTIVIDNSEPIVSDEAEAGVYPITVIDANGCMTETIVTITQPDELMINNVTTVNDDGSGNGSITVEAIGGTGTYSYSMNNMDFQSDTTFSGLAEGDYDITVMDENGCTWTESVSIIMTDVSDIDPLILEIEVMPNPASQYFTIELDANENLNMSIIMTDITGKKVHDMKTNISVGIKNITVDVDHLNTGIYLLNIATDNGHFNKKMVIQR